MTKADKKRLVLKADRRRVTGRRVKQLRRQGILPANIFGRKIKSVAIALNALEFEKLFRRAGETTLIDLCLDKDKSLHPVLISHVQVDPVSDHPLHVDFHQVDLAEKVTAEIPIKFIGESPAVTEKGAVLVPVIKDLAVTALPTQLIDHVEVDVSPLVKIGDAIHIKDIKIPKQIEIQASPNEVVITIQEPKEEAVEAPPTPAEGETPAEAGAKAEGETPVDSSAKTPAKAEGEKPAEVKTGEAKPGKAKTPEPNKEIKK